MNKKTLLHTALMVATLSISSAAMVQSNEHNAPQQKQAATETSLGQLTEQLVIEVQQQVSDSIEQQVGQTLKSLADSVKNLVQ